MKKLIIICLLLLSAPAWAQSHEADIIKQMESQGYKLVERERTWLGRIALEFQSGTHEREIIINPNNGSIIRDYKEPLENDEEDDALDKFYNLFSKKDD